MDTNIYELIKSKIDFSHWASDYCFSLLEGERYYKIPLKNNELMFKTEGYYNKLNKINKIAVFKTQDDDIYAQVTIYPDSRFIHTKHTNPDITTATYLIRDNEIIILNRFDSIGLRHSNNYSIYPKNVRPIYEKYFTDQIITKGNEKVFISNCPHFHFCSKEQTRCFQNQELSNSISIKCLIKYIKALKESSPKDEIQKHDLDMPFLEYLHNKDLIYESALQDRIKSLLNTQTTKFKQELIKQKIIEIMEKYKYLPTETNLDKILLDTYILKDLIEHFHNNAYLTALFSNSFISSINNNSKNFLLDKNKDL